jgi:tight adherence protein C
MPVASPLMLGLIGATVLLVGLAALLLLQEAGTRDLEIRIATLVGEARPVRSAPGPLAWLLGLLRRIGQAIHDRTRLYSEQDLAALAAAIGGSGLDPRRILPLVLGTKVVVMVMVPIVVLSYALLTHRSFGLALLGAVISAPFGMIGPEWALKLLRRPHAAALRRGAPDALDLLVVCTEAGMGLEAAIDQVAREMRTSNRPMAAALSTLVDELRILPDRRQAFTNFGNRSGVDGIRRMSSIISQALQFGTPLGQALRAVAGELRRERMTRLEAKAVRLPALLIFPLVAFILPSLFIALMGAPMLKLMDTLGGFSGK